MNDKFLPIGTVVLLKGAKNNVMITGYFIYSTEKKDEIFDYGACPYPVGIVQANSSIAFNHSDIEKVINLGYIDDEQKKLNKLLLEHEQDILNKFKEEMSNKQ